MALTSWKAFPFFIVSQVPVPADEDGSYIFDVSLSQLPLLLYGSSCHLRMSCLSLQGPTLSSLDPPMAQCAFSPAP
jgi:hypothetical protein